MRTIDIVNAFLEDTGLITATSYLLARGRTLSALFQVHLPTRETVRVGVLLGAIGLTEEILPGDRYPYVADTLMTTLAAMTGGVGVGLACAVVIILGSLIIQPTVDWSLTTVSVVLVVFIVSPLHRFDGLRYSPWRSLTAGVLAQAGVLTARYLYAPISGKHPDFWPSAASVLANGFAMALMTIVINDAWVRINSERNRLDAERYKVLASQAQLAAMRARIHPHFLYNTLSSIAGMCEVSSLAQQTTIRLGGLMRATLEASIESTVSVGVELDRVRSYLDIEQHRIGSRLSIQWRIDPKCIDAQVPPFSIQVLVENAVNHGIAPVEGPRTITITVRSCRSGVLVAVRDDGAGMSELTRREIHAQTDLAIHGSHILSSQLTILFGRKSRLRLFSRPNSGQPVATGAGTLAAFVIPFMTSQIGVAKNGNDRAGR
ncbi:MAG: sensor histidine kinase [Capsulimonadaceae bacterium]